MRPGDRIKDYQIYRNEQDAFIPEKTADQRRDEQSRHHPGIKFFQESIHKKQGIDKHQQKIGQHAVALRIDQAAFAADDSNHHEKKHFNDLNR